MVNYKFRLREPNSQKETSIRFQFYKDGLRYMYGTGKVIFPDLWDEYNEQAFTTKQYFQKYLAARPQIKTELLNVNNRLKKIEALTDAYFANVELSDGVPVISEWKNYLSKNIKTAKPINVEVIKDKLYITDILSEFLKGASNGTIRVEKTRNRYRIGTIKVYRTLSKAFTELSDYNKRKYTIEDINKQLAEDWTTYLYKVKNSSPSNVGKQHKHFKRVINHKLIAIHDENYELEKKGEQPILTDREIKRIEIGLTSFKNITSETTKVYLTNGELDTLYGLQGLADHHQKYLDVFLCGCYTALRYSDYSRLRKDHVKGRKISIITHKTKRKVVIPIRPELREILVKYDYELPKTYEQKMNKYIKEICNIALIDSLVQVHKAKGGLSQITTEPKYKLIMTHTARRTAITLMYLCGESSKDIMIISGHKTLASFETYLRITEDESLKRMQKSDFFKGNLKIA